MGGAADERAGSSGGRFASSTPNKRSPKACSGSIPSTRRRAQAGGVYPQRGYFKIQNVYILCGPNLGTFVYIRPARDDFHPTWGDRLEMKLRKESFGIEREKLLQSWIVQRPPVVTKNKFASDGWPICRPIIVLKHSPNVSVRCGDVRNSPQLCSNGSF